MTENDQNNQVEVTMIASREMFEGTRSSLEDQKNGSLTFSWDLDDEIYVTDTENTHKGKLTVISVNGNRAVFKGKLTVDIYEGQKKYRFYYLGNGSKVKGQIAEKNFNFANQNGLLSSFPENDYMVAEETVKFVGGKGTVDVKFKRQFAYAHFKLVYDDQTLDTKGIPVTISANNLASTASVDFTTANMTPGDVSPFTVTLPTGETADDENGFYVTLVPNNAETTLTFSCTVNNQSFIGMRTLSKLEKNDYYRNRDGYGAIPIVMNKVVTNTYNVVYHFIDDSETIDYKEIISSVYAISGQEATSYTVLDFGNVDFGSKDFARSDATTFSPENGKFSEKDIVAFLGWGKDSSNKASNDGNVDYAAGAVINLDELLNGNNGETLHLYAKSGYIEYKLVFGYNVPRDDRGEELIGGKYNECSPISRYREWGWFDVSTATTSDGKYPHDFYGKSGHEIIGWSRKQESSRQEGDEVIPLKGYVRIHKDDQVREDEPNTALNPGDKVATITVTLYPVWKKIENETIDITNYGTGSLE